MNSNSSIPATIQSLTDEQNQVLLRALENYEPARPLLDLFVADEAPERAGPEYFVICSSTSAGNWAVVEQNGDATFIVCVRGNEGDAQREAERLSSLPLERDIDGAPLVERPEIAAAMIALGRLLGPAPIAAEISARSVKYTMASQRRGGAWAVMAETATTRYEARRCDSIEYAMKVVQVSNLHHTHHNLSGPMTTSCIPCQNGFWKSGAVEHPVLVSQDLCGGCNHLHFAGAESHMFVAKAAAV